MNINEQINQLGRIGSVGYAPTDAVIDGLLAKTKRARAVRQGSAAVVGSVSAVALGVVGTGVYITIDHRNDAQTQDRNIENGLPSIFDFEGKYGGGYTGMDEQTRKDLDKIYADLKAAAEIDAKHLAEQKAAEAAAAEAAAAAAAAGGTTTEAKGTTTEAKGTTTEAKGTTTASCTYEEKEHNGGIKYKSPETNCEWTWKVYPPDEPTTTVPAGWIEFAGGTGQCKNYLDAATGTTIFAAHIDVGDWRKLVRCNDAGGGNYTAGKYQYIYKYGVVKATLSGNTCTGVSDTYKGAPTQYSCVPGSDWVLTNPNFKYLAELYYHYDITQPGTWPANWTWSGTAWVYTEPTPPADPPPPPA